MRRLQFPCVAEGGPQGDAEAAEGGPEGALAALRASCASPYQPDPRSPCPSERAANGREAPALDLHGTRMHAHACVRPPRKVQPVCLGLQSSSGPGSCCPYPIGPAVCALARCLSSGQNTHHGARAHDHKVKGLALYRLS